MSSFQAFTTAVAAQVGTGNIIGASGAILAGGPGAIFWMWVIAFFGMATNYSEAVLAQKTKIVGEDGAVSGGPIYYIKKAFKGGFGKFLAGFFAVAAIIALGFVGSMVQSNSIAGAVNEASGVDTWIIGVILAVLAAAVFIGGVSRLASVTEKCVPVMALIYLLGGLVIICSRITVLPEAIFMIFKYAFVPQAIIGGGIGAALKMEHAWNIADIAQCVLAFINIPVCIIIGGKAYAALKDYTLQKKQGENPVYKSAENGVTEQTDFWQ